jgi:hypothetical protein
MFLVDLGREVLGNSIPMSSDASHVTVMSRILDARFHRKLRPARAASPTDRPSRATPGVFLTAIVEMF